MCVLCFASARALYPISSSSVRTRSGNSTNQVASVTSSGMVGCAPVTSDHKERQAPKTLPNRDAICPKYMRQEPPPLRNVTSTSFVQHLSNIPMRSFNRSVGTQIVGRDSYPRNSIFLLQPPYCLSKRAPIICYNLN